MYGLRTIQERGDLTVELWIFWATKVPQCFLGRRLGKAHDLFDATVAVRRYNQDRAGQGPLRFNA